MENKRLMDFAMILLLIVAAVLVLTVSLLVFTFIFAWVADLIDNGYAVIHSVALVFAALIIAVAICLKK